jgi:hypothetical protein
MAVTDLQQAALRAQLGGDIAEYRRLLRRLETGGGLDGYLDLVAAGFFEAVDRRFAADATPAEVVSFVDDVRHRFDGAEAAIDPVAAESLILDVLGQDSVASPDPATCRRTQTLLLPVLVVGERLDDAGLDEFVASARHLADAMS